MPNISLNNIPIAESAKVAVMRPTTHFKVVTGDNPDMKNTLRKQQEFVRQGLLALVNPSEEEVTEKINQLTTAFQKKLSDKAQIEQTALIKEIRSAGIPIRTLWEDKGVLENGHCGFYTDQIFATDTGLYFEKDDELCFIPACFKNPQRQGEERLASANAENMGATVTPLRSRTGESLTFEGGDVRQMIGRKLFFIGQGHRSDPKAAEAIEDASGYTVVPIKLLQEQFYHLDCCFLPLPGDAAVIYEGEYELDGSLDENGWPKIIAGTATMAPESRARIRQLYPPEKLVLIGYQEALAFATNAVILQHPSSGEYHMFVNGSDKRQDEKQALAEQKISYTSANLAKIQAVTGNTMTIHQTPYSTMHVSGGSIRCTVLELACKSSAISHPHVGKLGFFSKALDKFERRLQSNGLGFFRGSYTDLCRERPSPVNTRPIATCN